MSKAPKWPEIEMVIDVVDGPPLPFPARTLDEGSPHLDWRLEAEYLTEIYLPKSHIDQATAERDAYREALERIEVLLYQNRQAAAEQIAHRALANYRKGERQ